MKNKKLLIILLIVLLSTTCANDNNTRGSLDGVWKSDIFDVKINGNVGYLEKFSKSISAQNIPQIGDTVIVDLTKISSNNKNFIGVRIFLQKDESFTEPQIKWEFATFNITIPKDSAKIYLISIGENNDTIIFEKN
ncbi:MAG: hypothetical protein LBB53_03305 [Prevotellaceae bacterium]|jgi:hypothetical protein|nr:hypothetical protein [Prevotellaceae bacterium]